MNRVDVTLTINGETARAAVEPRTHLTDFLREERLLTGTHLGCEQGVCGACTLMVDGRPVRSCLTLAVACDGADVRTVEGYDDDALMARIRDAFMRHHGLQCGYCTPGMLATAYDIVRRFPGADETEIRKQLSGNLCRCTGYSGIVAAIRDVIENDPPQAGLSPLPRTARGSALGATGSAGELKQAPASSDTAIAASAAGAVTPIDLDAAIDGETLKREIMIDAPIDDVWKIVSDIPSVVACIPGTSLDGPPVGDTFTGRFVVAMGPMTAQFRGSGAARMDDATRSGRVAGRGRDGLSRTTVDGAMDVALSPSGADRTRLQMETTYVLRGPLAQFGRKALVEEVADRLMTDVGDRLAARAKGEAAPTSEAAAPINGFALIFSVIKGLLRRLFGR